MADKKIDMITQKEAADRLDIHASTLSRMCARGEGPTFYRIGRQKMFPVDELEAWMESRREQGAERAN